MFDRGIPSICYGLRGLVYFQIDLRGTKSDLHSGSFGGAVANPTMVLAQILSQMKDKGGRIKIPGFYDDVKELRDEEREQWKRLPFNERRYAKELGAPKLFGESGYSTLERVWARPTFEVNGMLGGFTGDGAKTVIPAVAMAKVSMRLVPDQDPDKIAELFEAYVKKVAPKTVDVKVTRMHGGKPWMTEFDNPFVQAAGRAIEKGFGKAPVFNREGGSIPVVATFQEILGLPVGALRRRPARRERARAEREARPAELPRRDHRVGVPLRRDRAHPARLERSLHESPVALICRGSLHGGRVTQERRRAPRYRIEATITVDDAKGRTIDLSSNGVLFETARRFVPGDRSRWCFPSNARIPEPR